MATSSSAQTIRQLHGFARVGHVLVRHWTGEGLPTLIRTQCFHSSGAAEAAYQRARVEQQGREVYFWMPSGEVTRLLADEVAGRLDDAQVWRNYADWAWRQQDRRAQLVELHEALEFAPNVQLRGRLEHQVQDLEASMLPWRREICESHVGNLRFRRGHLVGVSGLPRFELPDHAPTAIAELELQLSDSDELEALQQVLGRHVWRGLVRCAVRLTGVLDDEHGSALLQLLWRALPHLRELELCGSGHLCAGPKTLASLRQLLLRHRGVVCGEAIERLHLDLDPAEAGWSFAAVADLIEALTPSGLRELTLRTRKLPIELYNWAQQSGFAQSLRRCELRERARPGEKSKSCSLTGPRPRPPVGERPHDAEELLVWADWLEARGEPLGAVAMAWANPARQPEPQRQTELRRARARVERSLGIDDELLACEWNGPVISRLWLRGRSCESAAALRRVLSAEACVALEQLTVEDATPRSLALLRASASEREPSSNVRALLRSLARLHVLGAEPIDLGPLLEALPGLTHLSCHGRAWGLGLRQAHVGLRSLSCAITTDLDQRTCARNFAKLGIRWFPQLCELTLELEQRNRGRAIPFERLELPVGTHLRIRGPLRESDVDGLRRLCRSIPPASLEIRDPQSRTVERRIALMLRTLFTTPLSRTES